MQLHGPEDLATLRRRCKASLDAHRRRAAADRQALNYTAADLVALAETSDRCAYCGTWLTPASFAFDHKTPTCRSADYRLANVCACCRQCHEAKGLLTAQEYLELLALVSNWHPRAGQDLLARLKAGGRRRVGG